jgi:hypothetical protein
MVEWLDTDGGVGDAAYLTLEQFEKEGIRFGRGLMPWASGGEDEACIHRYQPA